MSNFSPLDPPRPQGLRDTLYWHTPHGSACALGLARLAEDAPLLVITADTAQALRLETELRFFSQVPVLPFPDWETLPYDSFSPHQDIVSARLRTLRRLQDGVHGIVLVPINTLMQRLPPVDYIAGRVMNLEIGQTLEREGFRDALSRSGYRAVETVFEPGEYALRGALIDLFPMGSDAPLRIDLFDDEIDTLRHFDPDTQRSQDKDKVEAIELLPAHEYSLSRSAIACFREGFETLFDVDPRQCPLYVDALKGIPSPGLEQYLPLFFEETATLFEHLAKGTRVALLPDVFQAAEHHWTAIEARFDNLGVDPTRPLLPPHSAFVPVAEVFAAIKRHPRVELTDDADHKHAATPLTQPPPQVGINARAKEPLAPLASFIEQQPGIRILFVAESRGRREALEEALAPLHLGLRHSDGFSAFLASDAATAITEGELDAGLWLNEPGLAVISEAELYGGVVRQSRRREKATDAGELAVRHLSELRPGAPVVHQAHGVGRYRGLETLEAGGQAAEFVTLEYAEGARLYVPVDSLHLISRYAGADDELAPLNRLGSEQWEKARRRAAEKIRDTAAELLDIYARREARQGFACAEPDAEYARFAANFPFEETPDQHAAITAVIEDMTAQRPMDRVVCGDVGFGKTEVAMRAAFLAVHSGRQVVVLVPTTLLARQHFENFRDRFADTAVNIELISRFTEGKGQAAALKRIENGQADIVIGTHKLLSKSMKLPNMGLLIIDEEHRFGVAQKERLKSLRAEVDILTMTATPIPRTLNMAMSGIRDLSIIATPPARRLSVKTFVQQRDEAIIKEALLREILRGGQVYLLHNEVKTIESAAEKIRELVPEARVGVAHGQLPERSLERVMSDFYHKRFNVLVCSTIIETGIDVPSANTIIIERADKFGLAQLHQLRGRVGRSHHQAYAYLLAPPPRVMTRDAVKRLEAIAGADALGAGFTLASHDMEIRGAGELLGEEQSGQMEAIGYGLYMEMLDRAVAAIRAGKTPNIEAPLDQGVEISLNLPALIPDDYLHDVQQRLVMYKRIASAANDAELKELQVEMIDRFGLLPAPVKTLIRQTRLRQRAEALGITRLEAGPERGRVIFGSQTNVDPLTLVELIQKDPRHYRLDGADTLRFDAAMDNAEARFHTLEQLLGLLNRKAEAA
ncbi:transcription-repair coupling factor [Halomonas urumqiensis]|uniref:Transcription-repair-coupling factor n=1 Tax=Halomonas urumqiensis TaxID=1684789 RepID=A0A2N7UFP7_9GAMM|nr:transcription-repair coupling factor [Halomonas urumqiensis]PMR79233.1 transcription-repair coupling factor [Halomonas urumqiensis]PTB03907.1 transcription-repair coupling factor [Halomonas urumqiensis]GHE19848.1 transcription-repair-coupling factor [Halomonas urumqiensis]